MVTADRSIEHQQNLRGRKLALVVLSTNDREILEGQAYRLVSAVDGAVEGGYQFIQYERPIKPGRGAAGPKN